MAYRYRQVYVETGDLFSPAAWVRNLAELSAEFNNALDRDNLPEAVVTEDIAEEHAFTAMHTDQHEDTFLPVATSTSWQGTTYSGDVLGEEQLDVEEDCIVTAEWGGSLQWILSMAFDIENCVCFRIALDGNTIAHTGWLSIERALECVYMIGASPCPPGKHKVSAEIMCGHISNQDAWSPTSGPISITLGNSFPQVTNRELIVEVGKR